MFILIEAFVDYKMIQLLRLEIFSGDNVRKSLPSGFVL